MRKLEDQEVQHLSHVFSSPEREHRIQKGGTDHHNNIFSLSQILEQGDMNF